MAGRTGRFAAVDGVGSLMDWSISDDSAVETIVASSTRGATARRPGNQSFKGSWNAKGGMPSILPGAYGDFSGYAGDGGAVYSGNIIVDQIAVTWNFETGAVISHALSFTGNGALTVADVGTAIVDATHLTAPRARDCSCSIGSRSALPYTTVVLTITAANQARNDAQCDGWQLTEAGNIDATLAVTLNEDARTALGLTKGENVAVILGAGSGSWSISDFQVISFTGIQCNRSGAIIKQTVNFGLDADNGTSLGTIVSPESGSLTSSIMSPSGRFFPADGKYVKANRAKAAESVKRFAAIYRDTMAKQVEKMLAEQAAAAGHSAA